MKGFKCAFGHNFKSTATIMEFSTDMDKYYLIDTFKHISSYMQIEKKVCFDQAIIIIRPYKNMRKSPMLRICHKMFLR
jgi:hypothetical protein